jgi:hypothetical protein
MIVRMNGFSLGSRAEQLSRLRKPFFICFLSESKVFPVGL